ncbi:MAG: hypothetical protein EZS28_012023 [Streblomastix strix]|uniref:Uncharacterized protein n=1 Tax=Streblomastix strix TaxID=222440 RepID=A0A5J4WBX0_9EUKA|nr:MAG: hypothetical protein EZS28_012023 [Streblomastix strix]
MKDSRKKKEHLCEVISASLCNNQNKTIGKQLINVGVADALIQIFKTQQLNSITGAHIDAFYYLVKSNDNDLIETLVTKQPLKGLIRLLDHSEARPSQPLNKSQNPILNISQIEKIFALFNRKLSADTTNTSALCLSLLFNAKEIANQNLKSQIITHLKSLVNDKDRWMKNAVRKMLRELALNEVYKAEIEKDGFVIPK